jgi:hypothetical protein
LRNYDRASLCLIAAATLGRPPRGSPSRVVRLFSYFSSFERQNVGLETCPLLLGKRVVFQRQQAIVENVRKRGDPTLMEMVEDSSIHSRPVMDRHGGTLGSRPGIGGRSLP